MTSAYNWDNAEAEIDEHYWLSWWQHDWQVYANY